MNTCRFKKNFLFVVALLVLQQMMAQPIASLVVKFKDAPGLAIPVQVNLDAISFLPDSVIQLVEVNGKTSIPIASQIEYSNQRILHWIIEPEANKKTTRTFELVKKVRPSISSQMKALAANGFLTISNNNKNLLRYNFKTIYPPKEIDTAYRRSGFIHPLWSPRGQELSQINAPDHYHHWGLWNPWTEVLFESDTVDFWNLAKKQGTVKFANFVSTTNGSVFAGYKALHEHVVFKKDGGQKIAL